MLSEQLAFGSPVSLVQRDTMFKVQNGGSTYFIYVRDADPNPQRPLLRGIVVAKIDNNSANPPVWVTIPQAINHNGSWILQADPISHVPPRFYIIPLKGDVVTGECGDGEWLIPHDAFNFFYDQRTTPDEYTLAELLSAQRHNISGAGASTNLNAIILDRHTIPFYVQRKFAAPLAALVALLIALPLAIHFGRSGGYVGLLLSVVIAFFFVISQQWMQVLAERNYLSPVLAAWAPDVVFGLLGVILLLREE
jgi:lipopolysaccharide export system permease protein